MLTTSEIKRSINLETKKQSRLSMCGVGGVGQPRQEEFGAFCSTVHSRKRWHTYGTLKGHSLQS
jgi:hypothetical protein